MNQREILLAKAVVSLRSVAGSAFDELMVALVARADHLTDLLVGADSSDIHRLQGGAQEARNLLKALAEATANFEKIQNQQGKMTNGSPTRAS